MGVLTGYRGERQDGVCKAWSVYEDGKKLALNPRRDLCNHSPTGFQWGYAGSGPAQLALAIVAHYGRQFERFDGEQAVRMHQEFKRKFIQGIESETWEIPVDKVSAFVDEVMETETEKAG